MSKAKQMRLIGRPERIPRPTSIGARGQANQVVAVADGRLEALVELEALSRLDESRDQPGAAVDDVEALRKRREFGAREPRGPRGRDKIVALKRGSRFDAALRDARKASIKSVVSGRGRFVDRGEPLRQCADCRRRNYRIVGKGREAREKEANSRRAIVNRYAHRAIGADPLTAVGLHRPAEPVAATVVPDSVAAEPPADADCRLQKTLTSSAQGNFACCGRSNGSTPPGPSHGRPRSMRAEAFASSGLDRRADAWPQRLGEEGGRGFQADFLAHVRHDSYSNRE